MAKNQASTVKDEQPVMNVRLLGTMFGIHRHRPSMGLIARRSTMLTITILLGLGILSLFGWLKSGIVTPEYDAWITPSLTAMAIISLWFSYRIIHWYKFAEFLIAVQNEMAKVSWPKKPELINSSIVVILTMFLFTFVLFVYDLVWQALLRVLGIAA